MYLGPFNYNFRKLEVISGLMIHIGIKYSIGVKGKDANFNNLKERFSLTLKMLSKFSENFII